ncbi:metallophosphoesterase [Terrisporobacter sp.]
MKNKKIIIGILLSISIICFPLLSISKNNTSYPLNDEEYKISMDDFSKICLTPGENETMLNFCWYDTNPDGNSQIKIWEKYGDIMFYKGLKNELKDGFVSNKVTVKNLKENTTYYYSYSNDGIWTKPVKFKTKSFKDFNFAFMGDPQIGASSKKMNSHKDGIEKDSFNWNKVIKKSLENNDDISFLVCGGDETNTIEEKNNIEKAKISNIEYAGFLNPNYLRFIPVANTIGNHDKDNENFCNHFNMPNTSHLGETKAGGDYYFTYSNTLFLFLNTNNLNINEHKEFIENAMKKNTYMKWKIAVFHHDIYGGGIHNNDKDVKELRHKLPYILEKNNIDLVLCGHDHIYSRTYPLKNNKKNSKGIVYITGSSSTGSKFYKHIDKTKNYIKSKYDKEEPTYTIIKVSENNIIITTNKVNDDKSIDNKIIIEK